MYIQIFNYHKGSVALRNAEHSARERHIKAFALCMKGMHV